MAKDLNAMVEIEDRDGIPGVLDLQHPSDHELGSWSVRVAGQGNEDVYFAGRIVRVRLIDPWDGVELVGRAMPTALTMPDDLSGPSSLTLVGDGELKRDFSRYLSAKEISEAWTKPVASVRRLASVDKWRRTEDGKRPVLYHVRDVEKTMKRINSPSDAT